MSALELSAVLFDMDGTLFDTERLSLETWLAVGQEHGWTQVTERYSELIGQNRESIRAKMRSWLGPDFPVEEFLQTVGSLSLREFQEIEGAVDLYAAYGIGDETHLAR